ncbi:hypothetical protein ACRAWF_25365 [Streptomyces sp. L7]
MGPQPPDRARHLHPTGVPHADRQTGPPRPGPRRLRRPRRHRLRRAQLGRFLRPVDDRSEGGARLREPARRRRGRTPPRSPPPRDAFLSTLSDEQEDAALYDFDDPAKKTGWSNFPTRRGPQRPPRSAT